MSESSVGSMVEDDSINSVDKAKRVGAQLPMHGHCRALRVGDRAPGMGRSTGRPRDTTLDRQAR